MLGERLFLENKPAKHQQNFVDAFLKLMPQLPALNKLMQEASQKGPIALCFVESKHSEFGGSWDANDRTIRISKKLKPLSIIDTIIFELCNANNPYIDDQKLMDPHRYQNAYTYAYAIEHCEYHMSELPSQDIMRQVFADSRVIRLLTAHGISHRQIKEQQRDYKFKNFHEYLKTQLEEGHTQAYQQDWEEEVVYNQTFYRSVRKKENYNDLFLLEPDVQLQKQYSYEP